MLLVVARVEGEGDDLRGDFGREAREAFCSQRHERPAMGLLVRLEAAGHEDLAQVGVSSVGRNRATPVCTRRRVDGAPTIDSYAGQSTSPQRRKRFMLSDGVGAASKNGFRKFAKTPGRFLA